MTRSYRPWNTREVAWLRANAGTMSVGDLAAACGRTARSVETMLQRMGVSQRCHRSRLVECPECHRMRTRLVRGACPVCVRRATAERQREREDALVAKLSDEQLSRKRPALRETRRDPPPTFPPLPKGMAPWQRERELDRRAVLVERWEVRQLDRENSTRRQRIDRLERQLRKKSDR